MRRRGLTLVEVMVAMWLLLAVLVMASAILHQTLRHLRRQEHTTRGTFLAQGKLEEYLRLPTTRLKPEEGHFDPPFQDYGWAFAVERREDREYPVWELTLSVTGPCQSEARVRAQRRLEPRSLWFASNRDGCSQLYRINQDGTELKRMTQTTTQESQPALSPDGSEVAFVSTRAGHPQIYVMPATAPGPAKLAVEAVPSATEPAWSPDGKLLAYTAYQSGVAQVMVLNLDSGLTENRSDNDRHETSPCWSPSGNGLLFVQADPQSGGSQIGWLSASGERKRRLLTHEQGWNTAPSMAPDGATVAFMSGAAGNPEICLMNASGGQRRRLTENSSYDHGPRFSSDGQCLVFWSERNGTPELFTLDLASGRQRRVLNKGSVLPGQFERDPAWAP